MIRRVLVYTYGNHSHDHSIRAAATFAAHHQAELIGLFVEPDVMGFTSIYGSYPLNLAQTFVDQQDGYEAKIKASFEEIVGHLDIQTQWHRTAEYEKQPRPSFYSDITFVGQVTEPNDIVFDGASFIDHLITDTGLPTVVVPTDWSSTSFAQRPVLAWRETREAAGAVRHTLPLMRAAENVHVVSAYRKTDLEVELIDGIEICQFLAEHEVKAEFFSVEIESHKHSEAGAVCQHVNEHNRDLIIAGGYGHSRLREIVLGGMTRGLLAESPVPVLFSH
ncbi:universal stress protein [Arenicella xantha]|uniref:Nucleotide-binding universal stress UspA family protein n=1 Tax=Arenicella xantha TaxID=644221 RepID=A0A395JJW3_9GAMM|nr:universal stress protein [Arenicella xantha]RBP50705.1 nucleotide-binding universal stress UspA family protein [Arenicella xantha]